MLWHPKLNQILAGTQKGAVHCLYDPAVSVRGAVMVAGRTVKKAGNCDLENASLGDAIRPCGRVGIRSRVKRRRYPR